jgi:PAS domain S-box-containing protein
MDETVPLLGSDADARSIADAIPHVVWVAEIDGTIVWFNGRWYDYTGLNHEHSLGMQWAAVIHHDDIAGALSQWSGARHAQRAPAIQLRLRARDGSYRWFTARATAVSGSDGRTARWVGTCTDIDDQRRAEAARAVAAEENHLLYERLRFLAEAGEALAETLSSRTTLDRFARLIVENGMADWAVIDLIVDDSRIEVAAVAHRDPAKEELANRLRGVRPIRPELEERVIAELQTTEPFAQADLTMRTLERVTTASVVQHVVALNPRSVATIPLRSQGRTLGALVTYWAESDRTYGDADLPMLQELARRAASAIENAQLFERERQVASAFQRAALPSSLPRVPGLAFDAVYQPARNEAQVGGDWYDALRLADGRIVYSIGDVAGSGLEAAVIMAAMRQVIRGVMQVYADPLTAIEAADRVLKAEHPNRFVTAIVGVYDPVVCELAFVSAGHPPPLVRARTGAIARHDAVGLPLGIRERTDESAHIIAIADGDLLVLYTDGLIENTRDVIEGERRVHEALAVRDTADHAEPARAIFAAVLPEGASDDVVVFTTRFAVEDMNGDVYDRWQFDVRDGRAARAARLAFVAVLAEACRFGDDDAAMAELVFGELLSNVVRYAPGAIEIVLDYTKVDAPILHVLDRGPGFLFAPRLPSDILSERGRGLFLIWTLTDEINVTKRYGGGAHARAVLIRRGTSR